MYLLDRHGAPNRIWIQQQRQQHIVSINTMVQTHFQSAKKMIILREHVLNCYKCITHKTEKTDEFDLCCQDSSIKGQENI